MNWKFPGYSLVLSISNLQLRQRKKVAIKITCVEYTNPIYWKMYG